MTDLASAEPLASWPVDGPLLCARLSPLPASGKATAIAKRPSEVALWLGMEGLQGDRIAERRHHGGPERSLCHYPPGHYRHWQQRFAQLHGRLGAGAFGENLGCAGLDETQLCIGDRLRWGGALIEVSQPRSPCVRLDAWHGVRGLARELSASGRTGWLYRTLGEGLVAPGDRLQLLERPHPQISVAYLWRAFLDPLLDDATLLALAELPALAAAYRQSFRQRYDARRRQQDQHSLFD